MKRSFFRPLPGHLHKVPRFADLSPIVADEVITAADHVFIRVALLCFPCHPRRHCLKAAIMPDDELRYAEFGDVPFDRFRQRNKRKRPVQSGMTAQGANVIGAKTLPITKSVNKDKNKPLRRSAQNQRRAVNENELLSVKPYPPRQTGIFQSKIFNPIRS